MSKKFHSFSGRLTKRIVLVMLLLMSLVSGFVFIFALAGMTAMTEVHFQDILEMTSDKVEGVLNAVQISSVNNVDEIRKNLSRPEDVYNTLENELKLNPHIIGAAVGFVPDYFKKQGHWFEPYVFRRDDGMIERLQIGSENHDYLNSGWYTSAINSDVGFWTDPYFDESGAKTMVSTYSMPVKDKNGKVVGAFGADISLEWLTSEVRALEERMYQGILSAEKIREGTNPAYCFILGRNGEYISHPDRNRILSGNCLDYVKEHGDKACVIVVEDMLRGERGNQTVYLDGISTAIHYAPLPFAGWSMAVVIPISFLHKPGLIIGGIIIFLISAGLIVMFLVSFLSIRRSTGPLKKLAKSADSIAKGKFDTHLPNIKKNDEIKLLRDSFANMQKSLSKYVDELKTTSAQKASIESELSIARGIQMSMLPKEFPPFPDRKEIDIFAQLTSAKAVGGDLYDYFIREDKLFFCVGDVSGKGVPASIVMAVTGADFRTLSSNESKPERIVSTINEALGERNDSLMFVTLFVGVLDLETGELLYCNAGHESPILLGKEGAVPLDVESNVPIGISPGWAYVGQKTKLAPGTTIFIYTDGLSEAENVDHALFGKDRIMEVVRNSSVDPSELIDAAGASVREFVGSAEQSDDLTMLAIRYKGKSKVK